MIGFEALTTSSHLQALSGISQQGKVKNMAFRPCSRLSMANSKLRTVVQVPLDLPLLPALLLLRREEGLASNGLRGSVKNSRLVEEFGLSREIWARKKLTFGQEMQPQPATTVRVIPVVYTFQPLKTSITTFPVYDTLSCL